LCLIPLLLIGFSACHNKRGSLFIFLESEQGVSLYERGKPVYFYQKTPKTLHNEYICNNYLHPLYSPGGDTLTEESPGDHPYHRGIFWAWHQVYVDDISVADGWIMQDLSLEVAKITTDITGSSAGLNAEVLWKSPNWQYNKPFVRENTIITVNKSNKNSRRIDFEIRLRALVPDVTIGGSDDEKGYGGLCFRIKMPDDLVFSSETGQVEPQTGQVTAGSWMDMSGSFGRGGEKYGITIFCNPLTPNFPAPWILRQTGSMQNIVFPGRQRVVVPVDRDLVLKYQMLIHKGDKAYIKTVNPADVVSVDDVIDITNRMNPEGILAWNPPEGNREILRTGYTATMAQNAPATSAGRGLECDKMDTAELIEEYYYSHFGQLCRRNGIRSHAEVICGGTGYPPLDILRSNNYFDVPMFEFRARQDNETGMVSPV